MDGDEARGREPRLRPAAPPPGDEPAAEPATTPEPADGPATTPEPTDGPEPANDGPEPATAGAAANKPPAADGQPPADDKPVPPGEPTATAPQPAAGRHRFRPGSGLRRAPRAVARRIGGWARRPSGRLALPGLLLALTVAGTGAAGAFLVPATSKPAAAPAPSPSPSDSGQPLPDLTTLPSAPPAIGGTIAPTGAPGAIVRRPADVLGGWAAQLAPKVGIPKIALEAYGYAELVVARTSPTCGLKWTTLAAIGKVESNHGSANGATLLADGRAHPVILGAPLNGAAGTARIADTDGGVLDTDRTWDRAVGPMQFIPSTWENQAVDADNDGIRDPSDIDDAALAAANYLCRGGRNLADVGDWWAAILTYNDVQPYAQAVYQAANDYGARSRT